ncbi:methyltransferase-like protein 24 isoform X2 [Rhinatrema bivittatum]|uniref:methyltransferase-like protein 24 isoform X2 n=1 Tax=Rhinatrema bivittatum TaxID=194408 RepID=UPI00112DB237|nr:methyltransferase-like protein 24 isoform X2 [Rhinatrema bivittatum]
MASLSAASMGKRQCWLHGRGLILRLSTLALTLLLCMQPWRSCYPGSGELQVTGRGHRGKHQPQPGEGSPSRRQQGEGAADSSPETGPGKCGERPAGQGRRKARRWRIRLQPWASPAPSLDEEASRFLQYITTAQILCRKMKANGLTGHSESTKKPWTLCLDNRLGAHDNQFEVSMADGGCDVHRFDPSIKPIHVQKGQRLWYHRLSIDWRDPNPAISVQKLHSRVKKLGTILSEFGHWKVDVLKADMESAEWKILENMLLEDTIEQIGQLVLEIHLHWPGFEVRGNDSSVVRYWYSLLKELECRHFRLFHTYKDLSKPQKLLRKQILNASSCYTLSWVNSKWT